MTVGEKIKTRRKRLGLSQTELGNKLGVQKNAVSKWECGRVEIIPGSKLKAMSELFGVPISYLIDDDAEDRAFVNADPELTAYLEELRNRPEQRMLLSVTKDATKEEVEEVVNYITYLRSKRNK